MKRNTTKNPFTGKKIKPAPTVLDTWLACKTDLQRIEYARAAMCEYAKHCDDDDDVDSTAAYRFGNRAELIIKWLLDEFAAMQGKAKR